MFRTNKYKILWFIKEMSIYIASVKQWKKEKDNNALNNMLHVPERNI